jgi:hypothetical protein
VNASNRSRSFLRAAALSKFAPMANCSIPNSIPATGRTSTPSSARSKKLNKLSLLLSFDVGCSTLSACRAVARRRRVGRFLFLWRVKGAWWSSRSSKPSSVRKSRGRFDSCPLRNPLPLPLNLNLPEVVAAAVSGGRIISKGGESCRANKSVS